MGRFRDAVVLTFMLAGVSIAGQLEPLVNPVQKVVDAGVMTLEEDGTFREEDTVTRAELAAILVKAFDVEQRRTWHVRNNWSQVDVDDVLPSHWAYLEIQSVVQTGVMTTYEDDRFRPNQTVTRAEGFAAIAQAYGRNKLSQAEAAKILQDYPDAHDIPYWARPSLASVISKGWVNFKGDFRIAPEDPMTRGDIARALSLYLSQQTDAPSIAPNSVKLFRLRPNRVPIYRSTQQPTWNRPTSG